ncbi:Membrane-bound transcription factor site-2 protease-like protein, partial [Mucuna pruriens]
MEVEARRIRRFGPQRPTRPTLLPLHASSSSHGVSNTISCWYCDYKISLFNKPLFHFGRRYSRFLKAWFSIGVGFALSALFGVTLILLWELARTLHLFGGRNKLGSFASTLLFGFPSLMPGLSLSLADAGYICVSTIISVFVHEFGHAVAATSVAQKKYSALEGSWISKRISKNNFFPRPLSRWSKAEMHDVCDVAVWLCRGCRNCDSGSTEQGAISEIASVAAATVSSSSPSYVFS